MENPLLAKATISGDRGQTRPLTSSEPPPPKRPLSARHKKLIGELGLRYRPSAQADLEAHAASLALLTTDIADIPPEVLEEAIRRHASQSVYMPKAAELFALARDIETAQGLKGRPVDMAARRNAQLRAEGNLNLEWYYDEHDQIQLRSRRDEAIPGLGRRIR